MNSHVMGHFKPTHFSQKFNEHVGCTTCDLPFVFIHWKAERGNGK